jgi:hypothetical protein
MPVDRSLLPPLPGKPDWYVENAPHAVEGEPVVVPELPKPVAAPRFHSEPQPAALVPVAQSGPVMVVDTGHEQRRGLGRVFAGRRKH